MKLHRCFFRSFLVFCLCSWTGLAQDRNCTLEELLEPGDANRDLSFGVEDLLQVMRSGKFGTGEPASWAEGDWNGDGLFDETDVTLAFAGDHFLKGPYRLAVAGTPPAPRGGAPAIWLAGSGETPADGQILLFGGMNPITGDTYTCGAVEGWTELTNGSAPARRCHHTLVNDGQGGAILFGGFSSQRRYNDTFRFDPSTSNWLPLLATGQVPAPRCLHVAAYIPTTNEMLMYGGVRGGGGRSEDFFLDTSCLDLETGQWERISNNSPPGARRGATAVYSSQEDAVFMWGGLQVTGSIFDQRGQLEEYPSELWRFDPAERVWETAEVSGEIPIGREDPTHFWDDVSGRLYIFHGFNQTLAPALQLRADAYVLHLAERRWERLEIVGDTPEPRWRASSVFDPSTGQGWMFGGWQGFGATNLRDLWRFDLDSNRWIRGCTLTDQP